MCPILVMTTNILFLKHAYNRSFRELLVSKVVGVLRGRSTYHHCRERCPRIGQYFTEYAWHSCSSEDDRVPINTSADRHCCRGSEPQCCHADQGPQRQPRHSKVPEPL